MLLSHTTSPPKIHTFNLRTSQQCPILLLDLLPKKHGPSHCNLKSGTLFPIWLLKTTSTLPQTEFLNTPSISCYITACIYYSINNSLLQLGDFIQNYCLVQFSKYFSKNRLLFMWFLCCRFKDHPSSTGDKHWGFCCYEDECEPLDICQTVKFVIFKKPHLQMTGFSHQFPCMHMEPRPHIWKQANEKLC